jgi:hypothetical protein
MDKKSKFKAVVLNSLMALNSGDDPLRIFPEMLSPHVDSISRQRDQAA